MASTMTPNAVARTLTVALKRPITPKGVRTMARGILGRFDKTKHPEYQPHAYSAAEVATLRKAFAARTPRAVAQPARKRTTTKVAGKRVTRLAPVVTPPVAS